jgi:hypothetical protein
MGQEMCVAGDQLPEYRAQKKNLQKQTNSKAKYTECKKIPESYMDNEYVKNKK